MNKILLIVFLSFLSFNSVGQTNHYDTFTLINNGKGTDVNDKITLDLSDNSLSLISDTFNVRKAEKTGRNEMYNDTKKGQMIATQYKTSYYDIVLMKYINYSDECYLKIIDLVDGEEYLVHLHNKNKNTSNIKTESTSTNERIYDTRILKEKAEAFFIKYIPIRLAELDESGYAMEYEESRGDFEVGDINLDNIPDVIVTYTVEGIGRGNNWSRHIMLMTTDGEKITGFNNDFLYGRMQKECVYLGIQNGYAHFRVIDENYDGEVEEPRIVSYGIRNNKLVVRSR